MLEFFSCYGVYARRQFLFFKRFICRNLLTYLLKNFSRLFTFIYIWMIYSSDPDPNIYLYLRFFSTSYLHLAVQSSDLVLECSEAPVQKHPFSEACSEAPVIAFKPQLPSMPLWATHSDFFYYYNRSIETFSPFYSLFTSSFRSGFLSLSLHDFGIESNCSSSKCSSFIIISPCPSSLLWKTRGRCTLIR